MVNLLLSSGVDGDFRPKGVKSPNDLPVVLAARNAINHGGSGLDTVRTLLSAGASLRDCGGSSIHLTVQSSINRRASLDTNRNWLKVTKLFLENGSYQTSRQNWVAVVQDACLLRDLEYLKMLMKYRPRCRFDSLELQQMLHNAVLGRGAKLTPRSQHHELVSLLLGRSVDAQGRRRIPRTQLENLRDKARKRGMIKVVGKIEEFLRKTREKTA